MTELSRKTSRAIAMLVLPTCLICALVTVAGQVDYVRSHHGRGYVETIDRQRHEQGLVGTRGAPYDYRLLTESMLEGFLWLVRVAGYDNYLVSVAAFRTLQNLTIFVLVFGYLRVAVPTVSAGVCLLGVPLAALGFLFAVFNSDLSYSTYTEVILLLLAGLAVQRSRDGWIIPLTILGALNRESAAFFVLLLASARLAPVWKSPGSCDRRAIGIAVVSGISFFTIYFGTRFVGPRTYVFGMENAISMGLPMLFRNLGSYRVWANIALLYSITLLSLLFIGCWPPVLRAWLLWYALPWTVLTFCTTWAEEARLFLGVYLLVLLPAFLFSVAALEEPGSPAIDRL